ncbi:MAG: flagellar assembly protein FliW [Christensenella sp.]|uniref:flagellar assembly protein FliW n=1 Tax=Christensenella sp. TaxID=1935934 RepID=UPI002B200797|nr:flagellar assembly protein FliW [Christensenella sp.]MEA5003691.1 flagellar assembly protein FliW [Christensenella sp.]
MKIESERFGTIEINDQSIITFDGGLPGLEGLGKYAIIRCDQTEPIQWLQSIDKPDISIPIINPFLLKSEYEIEVDDSELELIRTHNEEDLVVLCIMVIPDDLSKMSINLMAPLLINIKEMIGAQVMMDYKTFPISEPAFEALMEYYKREGEVGTDAGIVEKSE